MRGIVEPRDEKPTGLFEKIAFAGTDGCASMRSVRSYEGVDGKPDGDNYLAFQKKASLLDTMGFHDGTREH